MEPMAVLDTRREDVRASSGLTVAETAQATGLSVHTLRYYDRAELLAPPRDAAGRRRYGPDELRALAFIARLRSTGMPIRQIKEYADAVRAGRGDQDGRSLLVSHRSQLVADIAERRAHLSAIDRKIASYEALRSRR